MQIFPPIFGRNCMHVHMSLFYPRSHMCFVPFFGPICTKDLLSCIQCFIQCEKCIIFWQPGSWQRWQRYSSDSTVWQWQWPTMVVIWLSSRRAKWWLEFYWCRRVECIKVVIMIIMSNNSVWLMCCCWWHIHYHSLLAILRKKVGKAKEEIRNLYGFHMNSSNKRIHMNEFIYMNSFVLWIHLIRIYFLLCP
jgi:hypothetical protein